MIYLTPGLGLAENDTCFLCGYFYCYFVLRVGGKSQKSVFLVELRDSIFDLNPRKMGLHDMLDWGGEGERDIYHSC